jgi:hypothetical protein
MSEFEKVKEELEKRVIADPMVIIKKIDFDCAEALSDYLELIKELGQ